MQPVTEIMKKNANYGKPSKYVALGTTKQFIPLDEFHPLQIKKLPQGTCNNIAMWQNLLSSFQQSIIVARY